MVEIMLIELNYNGTINLMSLPLKRWKAHSFIF